LCEGKVKLDPWKAKQALDVVVASAINQLLFYRSEVEHQLEELSREGRSDSRMRIPSVWRTTPVWCSTVETSQQV